MLIALGAIFLLTSTVAGLVSSGLGSTGVIILGLLVSVTLNFALFSLSFRLLCSADLQFSWVLPGAVLSAIVWAILQAVGGVFISHIAHSKSAYGSFAFVLGVLAWLHIGSQATVYSAELNVVLAHKLWPQALFRTDDPPPDGA